MASGIHATAKAAQEAALRREIAELDQLLVEREQQIAYLANLVAEGEAQAAQSTVVPALAPVSAPAPAASLLPLDPTAAARNRADTELSGLAIVARENPQGGSRRFWRQALDQLGRHLQPDGHPGDQQRAALADERGKVFVEACQQCRV